MRGLMILVAVFNVLVSVSLMLVAKGSMHEQTAMLAFLVACVLIAGQAIMGSVDRMRRDVVEQLTAMRQAVEKPVVVPARPVQAAAERQAA